MRLKSVVVAVLAGVLLPISSSAQEATPGATPLPEAGAPFGLASAFVPPHEGNIAGVFALLPEELAGEARMPRPDEQPGRMVAVWGEEDPAFGPPLVLQAVNLAESDFFPQTWTAGIYVSTLSQVPDYGTVAYGLDGDLAWILAQSTVSISIQGSATPDPGRTLYSLVWGQEDARWLFSASAFSPEGLEAIATAFVQTVTATPGATPEG